MYLSTHATHELPRSTHGTWSVHLHSLLTHSPTQHHHTTLELGVPSAHLVLVPSTNTRQDKPVPVVEIVRPEGAGFACGVIKPGHTLIMVNDRSLLSLSMRDSAKIIAEAADKVLLLH